MPHFLRLYWSLCCLLCLVPAGRAQETVPILSYAVGEDGRVQLEVASDSEHYYALRVRHANTGAFELTTALTPGRAGMTTLTEALPAYPTDHYEVRRYPIATPADLDGDGTDDLTELNQLPSRHPLNAAPVIAAEDGVTAIDSFSTFQRLSRTRDNINLSEFLNGKSFVKYIIVDFFTDQPKIYYIESEKHALHADFAAQIGIDHLGDQVKKGQVIYHPTSISNNGTLGTFAFNYSNGHGDDFETVQRTHELLAATMPIVANNLSYFITERSEDEYARDEALYAASRVPVLFEADVYADVDYWGLNQTEGYGFFRRVGLEELPGPRDVVLYESLPNDLPRVAGIMTSIVQTPLSHVNLRAIQNNVPNAFVRDPLEIDTVAALLDKPVYYRVEQDKFTLREATLEEVNDWFDDLRPSEPQVPPLNLDYTDILPLDEITFEMFDGFGAKCANLATMRRFGFPDGTIPDGYGVPFHFYQAFMTHNGLFEEARTLLADPAFAADRSVREAALGTFRRAIKDAPMPAWMLDAMAEMHARFPPGTSVRCRSSTNNEDLPGFNGAGLYDSKTQHPHEGHIQKSIKQVYASLWNLRAFEEREFYRIDHFAASMGVLCHPNFSDELANGVGVSTDPLYNTDGTFYLNTQVGEELITNPNGASIPEEILLNRTPVGQDGYIVVQRSNLSPHGERIMDDAYLAAMRTYLSVIHDEFAALYGAEGDPNFAMDIEYKITSNGQLAIKQARPWVAYHSLEEPPVEVEREQLFLYPNPAVETVRVMCSDCGLVRIRVTDALGRLVREVRLDSATTEPVTPIFIGDLLPGSYLITGQNATGEMKSGTLVKLY